METATLQSQKTFAVQSFTLFSDVSLADCASITAAAREKRFARRQTIFSEGDPVQQVVMLSFRLCQDHSDRSQRK